MGVCLEQAAGGTESVLARALRLGPGNAWCYLRRGRVPRLELLLRLCDLVDISLLDFLMEEDLHVGPFRTNRPWMKDPLSRKQARRPFDVEGAKQTLEQVLNSEEQPPPSLREVGRRLEYRPRELYLRFPELSKAISARHKGYRAACAQEKKKRLCAEIRQTVLNLHEQGIYPSSNRVAHLLSAPNAIQGREARMTWRETLRELGW